jgi:hypothetical protein
MGNYKDFEEIRQDITLEMLPSICDVIEKDFAAAIGVSKQHWYHMKKGSMPITPARQAMLDSIIWMYYHQHSMLLDFVQYRLQNQSKLFILPPQKHSQLPEP